MMMPFDYGQFDVNINASGFYAHGSAMIGTQAETSWRIISSSSGNLRLPDIMPGQTVVINTLNHTVTVDGQLIYGYDGDFFDLHSGNNRITIQNLRGTPVAPAGRITGTLVYQDMYY